MLFPKDTEVLDILFILKVGYERRCELFPPRSVPIDVLTQLNEKDLYPEEFVFLDFLKTGPQIGVSHEDPVQDVLLVNVQQRSVSRLTRENFLVDLVRCSIAERCATKNLISGWTYPLTRSHISTPRDQTSAMIPCPIPWMTSGAM